jgi:ubiquinone/menaquinone biosynthesis C-methylase UbiE
VGLDVSPAMLARARDRLAPRGVALVTGDVEALPCRDQSFDAATGLRSRLPGSPRVGVAELHRVLHPGSRGALTTLARPEATAYGPVLVALGRPLAPAGALAPAVLAR